MEDIEKLSRVLHKLYYARSACVKEGGISGCSFVWSLCACHEEEAACLTSYFVRASLLSLSSAFSCPLKLYPRPVRMRNPLADRVTQSVTQVIQLQALSFQPTV